MNKDEKTLRQYLLGDMSDEEQEALELWLMSDDEAYILMAAAEDDLIDESIAGKLNRDELNRFNTRFLAAPERKRKLRFSERFRRFVDQTNPSPKGNAAQPPASLWDFFRSRPAFGYAAAALIVLIAVGGLWGGITVRDLRQQLDSAKQQLGETQSLEAKLQADFQALEQAVAKVKASPTPETEVLVAQMLAPGRSRASSESEKIPITAKANLVQIPLSLPDDNYDSYLAVLIDEGGKELWTRDRLTTTKTDEGKAIVLMVPAERLPAGNYGIRLSGRSKSDPPENISTYYFSAVR